MSFWYKPPKKIDPNKIYDMMSSEGTQTMFDRSEALLDPNSPINQAMYNKLHSTGQENLYTQNRLNRMNMASQGLSGQSGVANAISVENALKNSGNIMNQFTDMMTNNLGMSNSLLQQATANDMTARDASASAYGQNITAQNNFQASKDAFWTQMGGAAIAAMSDRRLKKNIKKVGKVRTKDGKKVNLYSFEYKGQKKKQVGVLAQEIEKSHPSAVNKNKQGMRSVNYGALFG
ncbi:MAG: hypothetical protein Unbinned5123contig1000_49 [Prokaryotic dsDNA virus sp.]|nr:MAG: hypothetical protein Unbinned5123contig1000_49 [Prokaryotic dsDNA virus sp.]|tara:strand:+ start:5265 stop:5963 length:699 start_codon:yes stop_codon:yes gene_type:complete